LGYIVIRFDGSLIEKEPHVVKEKIMELLWLTKNRFLKVNKD
jgi:hypothetical protein